MRRIVPALLLGLSAAPARASEPSWIGTHIPATGPGSSSVTVLEVPRFVKSPTVEAAVEAINASYKPPTSGVPGFEANVAVRTGLRISSFVLGDGDDCQLGIDMRKFKPLAGAAELDHPLLATLQALQLTLARDQTTFRCEITYKGWGSVKDGYLWPTVLTEKAKLTMKTAPAEPPSASYKCTHDDKTDLVDVFFATSTMRIRTNGGDDLNGTAPVAVESTPDDYMLSFVLPPQKGGGVDGLGSFTFVMPARGGPGRLEYEGGGAKLTKDCVAVAQ